MAFLCDYQPGKDDRAYSFQQIRDEQQRLRYAFIFLPLAYQFQQKVGENA
jgi:hypothetical protein